VNDTSPEIAALLRRRYAEMDPVDRFMIGVQMFETARVFVLASLPPGLTPLEQRRRLCERLYGDLTTEAYRPAEAESSRRAGGIDVA
jgi:hypothetical protein